MANEARKVEFQNVRTVAEQARTWGVKKVFPVTSNKGGEVKTFEDGTPKMFLTDGIVRDHSVAISKNLCMMIAAKQALPQVAIADVVDTETGKVTPTMYAVNTNSEFAHEDYAMEF